MSILKPHPTNPHGVLVLCAHCGRELHVPRDDFMNPSNITCSFDCMRANERKRLMNTTTYPYASKVDPERKIRAEVAIRLESANLDWEEGRLPSPDTRDFVIYTREILKQRLGDAFIGTTPEGEEFVAEHMHELQSAGQLNEWGEMADWLVDCLVAE